jgi:hypothetical protein
MVRGGRGRGVSALPVGKYSREVHGKWRVGKLHYP